MQQQQQELHLLTLVSAALQRQPIAPGATSGQQMLSLLHVLARAPPGAEAAALGILGALTSQVLLGSLLQVCLPSRLLRCDELSAQAARSLCLRARYPCRSACCNYLVPLPRHTSVCRKR